MQLHNVQPVISAWYLILKSQINLFCEWRKGKFSTLFFLNLCSEQFIFLMCNMNILTRCTHSHIPIHEPLVPCLPVFPLPGPAQLAKPFATTHIYPNLGPLCFLHRVDNQVHYPKLYPLGEIPLTTFEWLCSAVTVLIWLVCTCWFVNQAWAFSNQPICEPSSEFFPSPSACHEGPHTPPCSHRHELQARCWYNNSGYLGSSWSYLCLILDGSLPSYLLASGTAWLYFNNIFKLLLCILKFKKHYMVADKRRDAWSDSTF